MNDPLEGVDDPTHLVVLSHLRWSWVWQRPQHLVARLARTRRRTWFVEEAVAAPVPEPRLRTEDRDGITRVWLEVPRDAVPDRRRYVGMDDLMVFGAPGTEAYAALLRDLLAGAEAPDVWLYSPMALDIAQALRPRQLIYDVMDDLASFKDAPEGMRLRARRALTEADLVFTGGRSLYRGAASVRPSGIHLFPSGVESAHYARARALRRPQPRPTAGYVGVVDERLDLDLVAGLAAALPDWDVRIVGPVSKVDPASLPQAPNLHYPGWAAYDDLPEVMAGFDVALMPFALNEATRSISPTKTLEYLAAGLPVVSTRIADVVADFGEVVHLADDAAGFAAACREVAAQSRGARDRKAAPLLARQEWDAIAAAMATLLRDQLATATGGRRDLSA